MRLATLIAALENMKAEIVPKIHAGAVTGDARCEYTRSEATSYERDIYAP